jgi:hypothetical protein
MFMRLEQPENTFVPIEEGPGAMIKLMSPVQPEKAESLIVTRPAGKAKLVRLVQP